jgi:hypothetical protein
MNKHPLDARSKEPSWPLLKQLVNLVYLIRFVQQRNQTNQKKQITVFCWRLSNIRFSWDCFC